MIITTRINMDLALQASPPRVHVVQDDKYSRNIAFVLSANGAAWEPGEVTGIVRFLKKDGTGGNYDLLPDGSEAVSVEANILTVALAPQVLTVPGTVKLAVGLIEGDTEINTFALDVVVQANPGLQAVSEGYYNVRGSLPDSGWEPNMLLGTDENGKVVTKTASAATGLTISGNIQPGQYLRVTGVDEDGNITVEAVDIDVQEAIAYEYNGVPLPALPVLSEQDRKTHSYLCMWYYEDLSGAGLICSTVPLQHDLPGYRHLYATADGSQQVYKYDRDNFTWVRMTEAEDTTSITYVFNFTEGDSVFRSLPIAQLLWANYNVLDYGASTVYLAASDPVPVYE